MRLGNNMVGHGNNAAEAPETSYTIHSNGDISITVNIALEGLTGAKSRDKIFGSVDQLLDCLNEIQGSLGLYDDILDIRDEGIE